MDGSREFQENYLNGRIVILFFSLSPLVLFLKGNRGTVGVMEGGREGRREGRTEGDTGGKEVRGGRKREIGRLQATWKGRKRKRKRKRE